MTQTPDPNSQQPNNGSAQDALPPLSPQSKGSGVDKVSGASPTTSPSSPSTTASSSTHDHPSTGQPPAISREVLNTRIETVELAVSRILRWGVFTSMFLIAIGATLGYMRGDIGNTPSDLNRLISTPKPDADHPITIRNHLHNASNIIVLAGLLVLILTPVARVAVSVIAFHFQRDRAYVLITSLVLALLILSFAMGYFFDVVVK